MLYLGILHILKIHISQDAQKKNIETHISLSLCMCFFLRNPLNRHYINSSREVESLPFS